MQRALIITVLVTCHAVTVAGCGGSTASRAPSRTNTMDAGSGVDGSSELVFSGGSTLDASIGDCRSGTLDIDIGDGGSSCTAHFSPDVASLAKAQQDRLNLYLVRATTGIPQTGLKVRDSADCANVGSLFGWYLIQADAGPSIGLCPPACSAPSGDAGPNLVTYRVGPGCIQCSGECI